jgi:hypothetical protein
MGWSIAARRPTLLGCTEIGLLVHNGDAPVLIVDTTKIHASACRASRPRRYAWHQSPLPSLTDGVSGATFLDGP